MEARRSASHGAGGGGGGGGAGEWTGAGERGKQGAWQRPAGPSLERPLFRTSQRFYGWNSSPRTEPCGLELESRLPGPCFLVCGMGRGLQDSPALRP